MLNRAVLIAHPDGEWANRINEALQRRSPDLMAAICDTKKRAQQYLAELYPVLVAATEELMPGNALLRTKIALIAEQGKKSLAPCLYKESPVEQTVDIILSALTHRTRITGVTSPAGGAGKTSVAVGLCAAAARHQRRAFYLNLESVMGNNPFTTERDGGLDKVIVRLDEHEHLPGTLQSAICMADPGGAHTFIWSEHMVDRDELTGENLSRLLTALIGMGQWDDIIVDMPSRLNDAMMRVWAMAEKMVVVLTPALNQVRKMRVMQRELEFRQRSDEYRMIRLMEKAVPVMNARREGVADDLRFGSKEILHRIPYIKDTILMPDEKWYEALKNRMNGFFDPIYEGVCL